MALSLDFQRITKTEHGASNKGGQHIQVPLLFAFRKYTSKREGRRPPAAVNGVCSETGIRRRGPELLWWCAYKCSGK